MIAVIPWFEQPSLPLPLLGRPIYAFGVLVATGVILGGRRFENRLRRQGYDMEHGYRMVAWMLVGGFVGGHLGDLLFYRPHMLLEDWTLIFRVWDGLSSYGGFMGGLAGLWLFDRFRRHPEHGAVPYMDAVAFCFPTGWLFGRMGCAVAHDHPGVASNFLLAVNFPGGPRHDLGLYEALYVLGVVVLLQVLDRKPRRVGWYLGVLPLLYAPVRFGLDFLRAGPEQGGDTRWWGLTPAQYFSLALVPVGLVVLAKTRRWARERQAA